MRKTKKTNLIKGVFLIACSAVLFLSCLPEAEQKPEKIKVAFTGLDQNGGEENKKDTESLTLTFDKDIDALTIGHITLTGATKVALSGDGTTRTLTIKDITAKDGETVSVSIDAPKGYSVSESVRTAVVYRAPEQVAFTGLEQNGGQEGEKDTESLTLTFEKGIDALTVDHITLTGATKVALSGIGTTRTLTIKDITAKDGETVSVSIDAPKGYSVSELKETVVYKNLVIEATQNGGVSDTKTTESLALTLPNSLKALSLDDIDISGAEVKSLSGSDKNYTLGICKITAGNGNSVTITAKDEYKATVGVYVISAENARNELYDMVRNGDDVTNYETFYVTNMSAMFKDYNDLYVGDISGWDVSNVTDMSNMFYDQDRDNPCSVRDDLSGWNVNSVTNMSGMFYGNETFNSDLSDWNVSNVTNMSYMFRYAKEFNSDISSWSVKKVTNMEKMFEYAEAFNCDISGWDVSSVTKMNSMFRYAKVFAYDISGWDVSSVTNMYAMFFGAEVFDIDLSSWGDHVDEDIEHGSFSTGGCPLRRSYHPYTSWYSEEE